MGRIIGLSFYRHGILFNPFRVVIVLLIVYHGFGLRPAPAAIIVVTPLGSGKEKFSERLPFFSTLSYFFLRTIQLTRWLQGLLR